MLFITPLVMAAVLLTPEQPDSALGAQLIAIGLAASWILLSFRRVQHGLPDHDKQLIAIFNRRWPNVMVMSAVRGSCLTLACGEPNGLYLLLPASLVALLSGVLNAWHFLLRQAPAEPR